MGRTMNHENSIVNSLGIASFLWGFFPVLGWDVSCWEYGTWHCDVPLSTNPMYIISFAGREMERL